MALKLRGARKAKRKEEDAAAHIVENDAFQEQGKKVVLEHPYFILGCVAVIVAIVVAAMLISSVVKSSSDAKSLEYAEAIEALDKAEEEDSADKAKAAYEKAISAFEKVMKNQSGSINAAASMVYSGRIYKENMNNCDKAVDFFRQAKNNGKLATDLRFAAYEGEAFCRFDKNEFKEAAAVWEEWLNQNTEIYKDYALYYIAMSYEKLGDAGKAAVYYDRIKNEYPKSILIAKIAGKVTSKESEKAQN